MAAPDTRQSVSHQGPQFVYRGRFAPSPSGPLHAGSILAALASYLDARSRNGLWFVRIEDLDPPRESREALIGILHALEALGLAWDGEILYQSQRHAAYRDALHQLRDSNRVFACECSRQKLADTGPVYPGYCRDLGLDWTAGRSLRCRLPTVTTGMTDRLQGWYAQQLDREVGDFVIRRRDGLFAYQLAVVVDDAFQEISDVVRGIDLLDSTPRQIHLQQCLQLASPVYAHIPIIVNALGQKLGKQQHAQAIDCERPSAVLFQALQRLQQHPEPALADAAPTEILAWASAQWKIENLYGIKQIPEIAGSASPAV